MRYDCHVMKFGRGLLNLFTSFFREAPLEADYLRRTKAFLADMRMQTNTRDLYRWARQQIREAQGQHTELSYLPGFVGWTSSRMPSYGYVEPNDGLPYVHLIWEKYEGRWGLKVGPPAFAPDPDSPDFHIEWSPGVYVWHERTDAADHADHEDLDSALAQVAPSKQ